MVMRFGTSKVPSERGYVMKIASKFIALLVLVLPAIGASAKAMPITVPKGTEVSLVFNQALSSKTAKVGQSVSLHVKNDVKIGSQTVLGRGAKVTGVLSQVDKRKSYGVNAKMRIALNPVKSVYGQMINLEPLSKGNKLSGKKTSQAAGATVGGAIIAGPVGLVGGYFIHGKSVKIKVGDMLLTEVAQTVTLVHK